MSHRTPDTTRVAMIGRTIGTYLLGIGSGLLLAESLGNAAIIGFLLIVFGIVLIGFSALHRPPA